MSYDRDEAMRVQRATESMIAMRTRRPVDLDALRLALPAAQELSRLRKANADLKKALSELLDAFECNAEDLMQHEYDAIVGDAKSRARAAIRRSA